LEKYLGINQNVLPDILTEWLW